MTRPTNLHPHNCPTCDEPLQPVGIDRWHDIFECGSGHRVEL